MLEVHIFVNKLYRHLKSLQLCAEEYIFMGVFGWIVAVKKVVVGCDLWKKNYCGM
jgi:hypothetical protein